MLGLLRALSIVPIVIAANVRREERRLVDWFRARGAFDQERAVTVNAGGAIGGFVRRRLEGAGVIRAAGNGFYFDEDSYAGFRTRRRKRAFVVATLVVITVGIGFLTGVITP
jgi:hypothetical protein